MELKPSQLRHFVHVASTKSFQRAAQLSFRSQPAISLAIKTLENQIGAQLFENSKRAVLTGVGAKVLPLVTEFLLHHDQLVATLNQISQGQMGSVSVAANPSVAYRWLADIIQEFTTRHPGVTVYASDDNSEKVRDLVAAGRVDLGIASLTQTSAELDFTSLRSDDFGVVCRSDHLLNKTKGPLKWSSLNGYQIIGNMTHHILHDQAVQTYLSKPKIFMSTLTSLLANVQGGLGVTVLPQLALPDSTGLVFKPLREPRVRRTIGLLELRSRTLPPEALAMRQSILRYFERQR